LIGDFLADWRRERRLSVVQVTHDSREEDRVTDRMVHLEAGCVGPTEEMPIGLPGMASIVVGGTV
jgi:ABC-type iron transport system FetAB ATPase subunit